MTKPAHVVDELDPADQARAILNILEDYAADRETLEDTQTALLNILEDSAAQERVLRDTQTAILNILEDSDADRRSSDAAFKASLNILSDLDEEKTISSLRAEQLARANADLQDSNQELEVFAYVASHDLSEPLRAIAGPISLLARRYRGQMDPEADQWIDFAVDGCKRMQTVINDLLAYSRVGRIQGELHAIDVDQVLASVVAALQHTIDDTGAHITIGPMPTVRADGTQLTSVFQNLLSNAMKFVAADVQPRIDVTAERRGDTWEFSVTDNGIGIAPAHRQNIFGMFKRLHTREEYPGTGIGLALVKKIIDRHGGAIGVTEAPGGGCRFWFTLAAETDADT